MTGTKDKVTPEQMREAAAHIRDVADAEAAADELAALGVVDAEVGGFRAGATNADLGPTEAILDNVTAFHSTLGCARTSRDVMIAGCVRHDPRKHGEPTFYDLYLTKQQAQDLRDRLNVILRILGA